MKLFRTTSHTTATVPGLVDATLNLLGHKATDRVTGFTGVITSVCFDLFGCVQAAMTPVADPGDKELKDGRWFDVNRLTVSGDTVMPVPDFDGKADTPLNYNHGAAPKPPFNR